VLHFRDGNCHEKVYISGSQKAAAAAPVLEIRRTSTSHRAKRCRSVMMNRFLLGTLGLVVLGIAAPAVAADLSMPSYKAPGRAPVSYDWGGLYVGLNGGGAWSHLCWTDTDLTPATPIPEGCHSASGGLVGGQIGYRVQSSSWVFGAEFQGDWSQLKGSNPSSPAAFTNAATNQTKIEGLGLLTGQVGYAWNNVLGYLKGGAAVTSDRYNGVVTGTNVAFDKSSEARWGGTVGAGVEYIFAPNWSVGAEYDHLFLGSRSINMISTGAVAGGPVAGAFSRTDTVKQDADLATVRVNYRWGGPVIAKH
jgi:outer membrane immunogenic protein